MKRRRLIHWSGDNVDLSGSTPLSRGSLSVFVFFIENCLARVGVWTISKLKAQLTPRG